MLKCGQKGNDKYTFGEMKDFERKQIKCESCGANCLFSDRYCQHCGKEIKRG